MYAEHIIYDRYVGREFNNNTEDASGRTSVVGEQQTTTATWIKADLSCWQKRRRIKWKEEQKHGLHSLTFFLRFALKKKTTSGRKERPAIDPSFLKKKKAKHNVFNRCALSCCLTLLRMLRSGEKLRYIWQRVDERELQVFEESGSECGLQMHLWIAMLSQRQHTFKRKSTGRQINRERERERMRDRVCRRWEEQRIRQSWEHSTWEKELYSLWGRLNGSITCLKKKRKKSGGTFRVHSTDNKAVEQSQPTYFSAPATA